MRSVPAAWSDTLYVSLWILTAVCFITVVRLVAIAMGLHGLLLSIATALAGTCAVIASAVFDATLLHRGPSTWFLVLGVLTLSSIIVEVFDHIATRMRNYTSTEKGV